MQIPITLHKEATLDEEGREVLKCGFKIGGGIDQDFRKSPQGYTDYVSMMSFANPYIPERNTNLNPKTRISSQEYVLSNNKRSN